MKISESFKKISYRYRRFLSGSYGSDGLNRFITAVALILCIFSLFVRSAIAPFIVLSLMALTIFRTLSKNYDRRRRENQMYINASKPVRHIYRYWLTRIKSRGTHRVFTCENCRSILRIAKPAGRQIEISCPKCGKTFIRRL